MYLSFGTSVSLLVLVLSVTLIVETLVILSAVLLPIKSLVACTVFWIDLFEAVFIASVADFLSYQEVFGDIYCLNFYPWFSQKTKIHILLHTL